MRVFGRAGEVLTRDLTNYAFLARESDNLRSALRWALEQRDVETARWISAVGLVGTAVPLSEQHVWAEATLALDHAVEGTLPADAALDVALNGAGWTAVFTGAYDRAQTHFIAYLALCQERGDPAQIAQAYRSLGYVAMLRSDLAEARPWVEQSLALCQAAHDAEGLAWSLLDLGNLTFLQGELVQAEQLLAQSVARFREQGHALGSLRACLSLGHVARAQGQLEQAVAWYRETITQQGFADYFVLYFAAALDSLAGMLGAQGHGTRAARLFGAAAFLREDIGVRLAPVDNPAYERDVAAVRAQLDEATFAAAWAEGQAMTMEQAIADALNDEEPSYREGA